MSIHTNRKAPNIFPNCLLDINAKYQISAKHGMLGGRPIVVLYYLIDKCIQSNSLEFTLTPAEWLEINESREDGGPSQPYRDLERAANKLSCLTAEHPWAQIGILPSARVPVFDRIQYSEAAMRGKFMPWTGLADILEP